MDPENFDIYGGVVHAEYCFQVTMATRTFHFRNDVNLNRGFVFMFMTSSKSTQSMQLNAPCFSLLWEVYA